MSELDEREARIEKAERDGYLIRGTELAAILDSKLYRDRFQTFEEYCERRWELHQRRPFQLIAAAAFAAEVHRGALAVPASERHIRPLLARLQTDDDRITVWRDVVAGANGEAINSRNVEDAITRFLAARTKQFVTLNEWHELSPAARSGILGRVGKSRLNKQENKDIEWADWSWNPVSGCLHGCPYCYARNIAFNIYPEEVGFSPTLWADRLTAPANQEPMNGAEGAQRNIFTCSMADLFGRWVPSEWIERVLGVVADNPQWNFLFLTKFPKRMSEFTIPANAWMGTTVDVQARVTNAEKAFDQVEAPVRWLSIEPMLEPLSFKRLDLFDWIVIGGASPTEAVDGSPATPAWNPPIGWISDLYRQARDADCSVYFKDNSGLRGMTRVREYPGSGNLEIMPPTVFDYLRAIPKQEQIG